MRRLAPRSLAPALAGLGRRVGPATTLAAAQACWAQVAGAAVAAEAWPMAERDGVLTVSCGSAVWAQELELLSGDLLKRLNEVLEESGSGASLRRLRFDARGLVTE